MTPKEANILNQQIAECGAVFSCPRNSESSTNSDCEIFRDIRGYEGIYIVSNRGRVHSLRTGKKFVPARNAKGYLQICLTKNGKQRTVSIHRIVAETFIPNPDGKQQINHKDLNKCNNDVSNLEWCNGAENIQHARKNGIVFNSAAVKKISKPVLWIDQNTVFASAAAASRATGISVVLIGRCCAGKAKSAHGLHFSFSPKKEE